MQNWAEQLRCHSLWHEHSLKDLLHCTCTSMFTYKSEINFLKRVLCKVAKGSTFTTKNALGILPIHDWKSNWPITCKIVNRCSFQEVRNIITKHSYHQHEDWIKTFLLAKLPTLWPHHIWEDVIFWTLICLNCILIQLSDQKRVWNLLCRIFLCCLINQI